MRWMDKAGRKNRHKKLGDAYSRWVIPLGIMPHPRAEVRCWDKYRWLTGASEIDAALTLGFKRLIRGRACRAYRPGFSTKRSKGTGNNRDSC